MQYCGGVTAGSITTGAYISSTAQNGIISTFSIPSRTPMKNNQQSINFKHLFVTHKTFISNEPSKVIATNIDVELLSSSFPSAAETIIEKNSLLLAVSAWGTRNAQRWRTRCRPRGRCGARWRWPQHWPLPGRRGTPPRCALRSLSPSSAPHLHSTQHGQWLRLANIWKRKKHSDFMVQSTDCLLYTSPSPRD